MAVIIDGISFTNEFRAEATDWLLANVMNKIVVKIDISVSAVAFADAVNKFAFGILTYNFVDPEEVIYTGGTNPKFQEFKTGDTITISNSAADNGTYTIVKINDSAIRVVGHTFSASFDGDARIVITTPITALNFFQNLIENSEGVNYNSKIDNSIQKMSVDGIDATDLTTITNLFYEGNKSWQIGAATIKGLGTDTFSQKFRITQTFFILPYYRVGEFEDNLQANIAPDLFLDTNSLKYVFKIEALYAATNPNRKQIIEKTETLGNVGWFNENFNNIPTNYTVDSIEHRRPDNTLLDSVVNNTDENTFKIVIKNTTDIPFSNNNTKITVNFSLCPDEDEYKDVTKNIIKNFVFDRALLTVGGVTVNGDNFGTDEQIYKDVSATFISTSEIEINGKINLPANLVTKINDLDGQRYIIAVAVQNHTLDTDSADLVTLLAQAEEISIPLTTDNVISFNNVLIKHYDTTLVGETLIEAFPGDEVIFKSIMKLDITGINGDDIDFKKLNIDLIAEKTSGENFNLESFEYDFSNDQKVNSITWVDFEQNRIFVLPTDDDRRLISIKRRTDLDTATEYYYEIFYPFLFRWEYWEALTGANNEFFDNTLPNNGRSHFWNNYNALSVSWNIKARIRMNIENEGNAALYESKRIIGSNDFNSNSEWINEFIKSYNLADVELSSFGGDKFVQAYDKTKIKAYFEKLTAFTPGDISVVIWAEAKEAGGIAGRTRISSLYDVQSESWFESIDATPRVKLTFGGGNTTVTAEAQLDHAKIPNVSELTIYARLYEKPDSVEGGKLTEADILKTTDAAGTTKTVE